jgi:hypothetical protein
MEKTCTHSCRMNQWLRIERRQFRYAAHIPERRSGQERRDPDAEPQNN